MVGVSDRKELQKLLGQDVRKVLITTIHKFGEAGGVLNDRKNIIVMVDEAHRTQEGDLGRKMREALRLIRIQDPTLKVDGEMQANFAVDNVLLGEQFPFSDLVGNGPNVFIFPGLSSANISYKLLQSMAGMEAVGPLLVGLEYPAHVLQLGCSVREIVNTAAMAVIDAQSREVAG